MARLPQVFDYEPLDKQDVIALKALNAGEADPGQQRLALHVIINKLSRAHDLMYIPGAQDETAFLNGPHFSRM